MLAAIFALWAVSFYKRTHDPNSSSDEISLRKPHAVQVLCILRLLGVVKTGMAACSEGSTVPDYPQSLAQRHRCRPLLS